jgi:hypothetical protein
MFVIFWTTCPEGKSDEHSTDHYVIEETSEDARAVFENTLTKAQLLCAGWAEIERDATEPHWLDRAEPKTVYNVVTEYFDGRYEAPECLTFATLADAKSYLAELREEHSDADISTMECGGLQIDGLLNAYLNHSTVRGA